MYHMKFKRKYININNLIVIFTISLFLKSTSLRKLLLQCNYTINFLYIVKILYDISYYINKIDISNVLKHTNYKCNIIILYTFIHRNINYII
ncbi:hypothetical protein C923_02734 [Plasmodium falciparum UGT5.1]|uniref:Uncharacterized protein n=1 Tax=Plasmodium falciparum UGT5.1 TaxID=1237627 RepID=W7JYF8_PLAFA|nr:hypothetical protein C923_02734 [Plasmodium falciparum UGT5.1]